MTTAGPGTPSTRRRGPSWLAPGDVNAFFGLAIDNLTNLVVLAGLLVGVFGFPADLVLLRMVPGTALGVLVGDLAYTWLAIRLARRTGRPDVTAMPFGIDTPSLFGITFGILGPVKLATGDPVLAWKVGMGVTVAMGVVKLALAFAGDAVRRAVPRAGLLGSIAGVALLLIAFLPALEVFTDPMVGLVSLALVLVTLIARLGFPGRLPGALAAVLAGVGVYVVQRALGLDDPHPMAAGAPVAAALGVPWPTLAWMEALDRVWEALPVALPFAVATVIGGIDTTESAIAAGDHYATRDILLVEAVATVVAGASGGVIQNTPYIGHPAYKAMGARAGYTLATALVIGGGAMVGVVSLLVRILPAAAVAPILIFIGLEITAQAFLATPARHAPAVALAFLPVAAALALLEVNGALAGVGRTAADLAAQAARTYQTLLVMANGFILSALLWGGAAALVIDRRLRAAAAAMAIASVASLCGAIHSPLASGGLFWPGGSGSEWPGRLAAGYGLAAATLLALSAWAGIMSGPGRDLTASNEGATPHKVST